jgi:hypothetical protein
MSRPRLAIYTVAAAVTLLMAGAPPSFAQRGDGGDRSSVARLYLIPLDTRSGVAPIELTVSETLDGDALGKMGRADRDAALAELVEATRGAAECVAATMEQAADAIAGHACAGGAVIRHSRDPRDVLGDLMGPPPIPSKRSTQSQDADQDLWDAAKDLKDANDAVEQAERNARWARANQRKATERGDREAYEKAKSQEQYWGEKWQQAKADQSKAQANYEQAKQDAENNGDDEDEDNGDDEDENGDGNQSGDGDCPEGEDCGDDQGDSTPRPDADPARSEECKEAMKEEIGRWLGEGKGDVDPLPDDPQGEPPAMTACLTTADVVQNGQLDTVTMPKPDDPRGSRCAETTRPVFEVLDPLVFWTDPSPVDDGTPRNPGTNPTPVEPGRPGTGPGDPQPVALSGPVHDLLLQTVEQSDARIKAIGF